MKTKILKFLTTALAVIIAGSTVFSNGPLSLVVSASASAAVDKERWEEGKKNASEDVDFYNDINIDRSFAYQIRMATNYHIRQAAVGNGPNVVGDKATYKEAMNIGNIACFYGYTPGEIETDTQNSPEFGALLTVNSDSSCTYNKTAFLSSGARDAYYYSQYGLMLKLIGFDSTGSAASDTTRQLYGTVALFSYEVSSFVNALFDKAFTFLISTNPFQFFKDIAVSSTVASNQLTSIAKDSATAREDGTTSAFAVLAQYFSNIFNVFINFAWTVAIPLSFLFIIVTFFLTRRGRMSFGSKIKQFLVKVVFIAIGIPILGSAYTQVLYALKETTAQSDDFISQSVAYTFLDFGQWVETNRLSPVQGIAFKVGTPDGSDGDTLISAPMWKDIRRYCYLLNVNNGVFDPLKGLSGDGYLSVNSKTGLLLKDIVYSTNANTVVNSSSQGSAYYNDNFVARRQHLDTVLKKYRDGTKYSASDFESGSIAWMQSQKNHYGDMLALSCDKYSFSEGAERQVHGLQTGDTKYYDPKNPGSAKPYSEVAGDRFKASDFGDVGYNIWTNGGLKAGGVNITGSYVNPPGSGSLFSLNDGIGFYDSGNEAGTGKLSTTPTTPGTETETPDTETPETPDTTSPSKASKAGYDATKKTGFSTMAMYVYLSSDFTQTGVNVYSTAPSVYTQVEHYAVNLIGGDFIMQTAFFVNMLAIQLGYFFMAFTFVFKAVFDILFKGFQVMGHALMGALGMYKSIGTCICMVINMVTQLFVCVVFFSFMTDMMFGIVSIVDKFLVDIIGAYGTGNSYSATASFHAELLVTLSSFISAFVIVFFVSFATKWRSLIIVTINGFVEQIVGALLGTQLSGASEGTVGNMAKASLSTAASVAGMATAAGVGVGAASGLAGKFDEMRSTMDESQEDIKNVEGTSAVDGAVNPTEGAAFDGGNGAKEGQAEVGAAEGEEILANGLGEKPAFTPEELAAMNDPTADNNSGIDSKGGFAGYHYGGTAEQQEKERAELEEKGVTFDENGNAVLARSGNDKSSTDNKSSTDDKAETDNKSDETENSGASAGVVVPVGSNGSGSGFMNNAARDTEADVANAKAKNKTKSDVIEDEDGIFWTQINEATGEKTGISFDPTRGLVMSSVDADGKVSDIAIGANGISMATTDENGDKTVTSIDEKGMTTTYTGEDGTVETSETTFDGTSSTSSVTRTNPDGTVEKIVSGVDGTVRSRIETTPNGIRKETTLDDDGNITVSESNDATGYSSLTSIDADGNSSQTESINGITTTTDRDVNGEITSQTVTSYDVNGNQVSSSYVRNNDGSYVESTTANGITNSSVYDADGNRTDVQSFTRTDGSMVETRTSYGNDDVADGTTTVIKNGRGEVMYNADVTTGNDSKGDYTLSTATTASGSTVQVKDYGDGNIITTETNKVGDTAVTKSNGSGGYTILETSASTGETRETTIDAGGSGKTIIKNASGETVDTVTISAGSDGNTTYSNIAGGSVTLSTVGEGANKENVASHSYNTGGSMVSSHNVASGNTVIQSVDGQGSSSTVTMNKSTGAVTTEFVNLTGNSGSTTVEADGDYKQVVHLAGGGSIQTVTEGEGSNAVTTINKIDAQGNSHITRSSNGIITYSEERRADGSTCVQNMGGNGSVTITSTAANGDVTEKVVETNGDFKQTTTYATGAKYVAESIGGVVKAQNISSSGIHTDAVYDGNSANISTQYAGFSVNSMYEGSTGNNKVSFVTSSGQALAFGANPAGEQQVILDNPATQDYMSYTNAPNGQNVVFVRNGNGSGLKGTVGANGQMQYVYTDATGATVNAPTGADTLNTVYANAMTDLNARMVQGNGVPVMTVPLVNPLNNNGINNVTGVNLVGEYADLTSMSYTGSVSNKGIASTIGLASVGVATGASIHRNQTNYLKKLFNTVTKNDSIEELITETTDSEEETTDKFLGEGGQWGESETDKGGSTTGTDKTGAGRHRE